MRGISPVMSATVVLAVIVASTFVVVNTLKPTMEKSKETAILESGKAALISIDNIMKELIYEAPGARRTLDISLKGGKLTVSGSNDEFTFKMFPKAKIMEPGSVKKEGDIIISYGPKMKGYEADVDNDGEDEYVIENDLIIFAVEKIYSPNSPGFINLSDPSTRVVSVMKNKITGTTINPTFKVSFNEDPTTMSGTGYTELVTSGNELSEGVIKLHLHCPVNKDKITYEVLFTLYPGQDFVHVDVKKI